MGSRDRIGGGLNKQFMITERKMKVMQCICNDADDDAVGFDSIQ